MKDKGRRRENDRLMSGVVRTERHCHWISDVGVKGQVNLDVSGMTLQRDDITAVERRNRSRCVYRDAPWSWFDGVAMPMVAYIDDRLYRLRRDPVLPLPHIPSRPTRSHRR